MMGWFLRLSSKRDGDTFLYGVHFQSIDASSRRSLAEVLRFFNLPAEYDAF